MEDYNSIRNVVGSIIGASIQADALRSNFLSAGDNPTVQNAHHDLATRHATANRPVDARAVKITDEIMKQMIERGDYVLRNNSLPFRWQVVPNDTFNASCYFSNFIIVHDGFVEKCGYNRDMVAAVLGHEMTHGFNQHIANSAAKSTWASALSGIIL